jgi:DNA modification methylase
VTDVHVMEQLTEAVALHCGDCLDVLKTLDENSIDACVTDPPYHLNFMNKSWDRPEAAAIDAAFANWFAGFVDGEGCFSVHKKNVNGFETYDCQFSITLRADDKPIILEIRNNLGGMGSVADRPAPKDSNGKPQVRYCISSQKDCQRLRAILEVFPLRAKKARDFEIWCHGLDAWIAHEPKSSWEEVAYFRKALMDVRQYGAGFHPSQLWTYRWAREVFRVLKPGAHLLSFGGTRTYHRMACAIEDAGFEIRDCVQWLYGSGFPKSHDVSKGIDRAAGAVREVVGRRHDADKRQFGGKHPGWDRPWMHDADACERHISVTAPATAAARQWSGFGTALKPACELIVLARKPLSEGTVAANVLRWGTGAQGDKFKSHTNGRWPANVCHDGSDEVVGAFPETGISTGGGMKDLSKGKLFFGDTNPNITDACGYGDYGSAARFFYTAKADSDDRLGSRHPTVKPLDLIQYLMRLVTPPGGLVLDPFAGTGTTGEAAWREGMRAVLIEREAEYQDDIRRRMKLCMASARERSHESVKAKQKGKPRDDGPLFAAAHESWDEMWERPFDYSKLRASE